MSLSQQALGSWGISQWLSARMWRVGHAFQRGRPSRRVVDDPRIRLFFLRSLFGLGFLVLAMGATRAALLSDAGKGDVWAPPMGAARADLVDRNGQMLAADLLHYGLYIDPREIWDTAETRK